MESRVVDVSKVIEGSRALREMIKSDRIKSFADETEKLARNYVDVVTELCDTCGRLGAMYKIEPMCAGCEWSGIGAAT